MSEDMVSGERWSRLYALLSSALEQTPGGRSAFLDAQCAGDASLREEIDSLLAAYDATGQFDAVAKALAPLALRHGDAMLGRRLGPFRVERVLGYGGMGTVYLGSRVEDQFEQRVALKIIRGGRGGEDARRRFLEERRILARLEHPNIARLIDGGITDEGEPYFAMEYVEGEPIDVYCNTRDLSVADRLRLFRDVCGTVQHAHRNLVVHRDLKPSNILVTASGTVKLLDFGIAKLLPEEGDAAIEPTRSGFGWLTPEYAAPEQLRGETVTTAADVYALGVVLYVLLTGRRPYRVVNASPAEVERIICDTQPEPPSAIVDRSRQRQLRGDLDTVVAQAMCKEPSRRYGSAAELAEDIARHSMGLPVRARPATLGYRASKFARRHRVALVAASMVVISLLSGIIGTTTQARVARQQRDRALAEAVKAERVTEFLTKLFDEADPGQARGANRTAREILDRGAARVQNELSGEPEVQASLMHTIGKIYLKLGLVDAAQQHTERALELRRRVLGEEHMDVSATLNDLGLMAQGRGEYARAESLYQRSLAIKRRLKADNTPTAITLTNLALVLQIQGEFEAAEKHYDEALALHRGLGNRNADVAITLNNLGSVKRMRGDYAGAEPPLREALAIKLELLGRDHPSTTATLNQIGVVLHARGDFIGAEALFREVLVIRRRVLGPEHRSVAVILYDLGSLYRDFQRYPQADSALREAVRISRTTFGPRHGNTGVMTGSLAAVLHERGDARTAESLYREAIEVVRAGLSPTHIELARPLVGLGRLLLERGEATAAVPLLREALTIRQQKLAAGRWEIAEAENTLGASLSILGQSSEAEPLLLRSHETMRAPQWVPELPRRRAREFLVAHYERTGQFAQATRYRAIKASQE